MWATERKMNDPADVCKSEGAMALDIMLECVQ